MTLLWTTGIGLENTGESTEEFSIGFYFQHCCTILSKLRSHDGDGDTSFSKAVIPGVGKSSATGKRSAPLFSWLAEEKHTGNSMHLEVTSVCCWQCHYDTSKLSNPMSLCSWLGYYRQPSLSVLKNQNPNSNKLINY